MYINTRTFAAVASVIAVGALTTGAHAQSSTGVSRPFTLKLGAFTPSDEGTRDFSGDTHFLLDATYEFGRVPDNPILFGVYGDYIFQTSNTTGGVAFDDEGDVAGTPITDRASAYGVGLQVRYLFSSYDEYGYGRHGRSSGIRPYIGGGIGFYDAFAKETLDRFDIGESKQTTGLGGKLMVGIQSRSGFLGEVSYHFVPTVSLPDGGDSLDLSGYGFSLGYRF